jgi:hypothetical protein
LIGLWALTIRCQNTRPRRWFLQCPKTYLAPRSLPKPSSSRVHWTRSHHQLCPRDGSIVDPSSPWALDRIRVRNPSLHRSIQMSLGHSPQLLISVRGAETMSTDSRSLLPVTSFWIPML